MVSQSRGFYLVCGRKWEERGVEDCCCCGSGAHGVHKLTWPRRPAKTRRAPSKAPEWDSKGKASHESIYRGLPSLKQEMM